MISLLEVVKRKIPSGFSGVHRNGSRQSEHVLQYIFLMRLIEATKTKGLEARWSIFWLE